MAEQTPSGETPPTAVSDTPAPAAPAAEVSSLEAPPSQDLTARVASAKSPAAVRALLSDIRKGIVKEAPAKPENAAATPAPEAPAPDATPAEAAPEETPAAEEAEAATPEAEAPEETEDDPTQDGPVTPSQAKKLRLRLPESDQAGRLAAAFMQRNRDWTLTQALEAANRQLGIKTESAAQPAKPEAKPKSDLPETVEAVDTTLESLDTEREKALTELRFEDVAKIDRKMRVLDRHRLNLEREGEKKQTQAARDYEAKFAQSEVKAAEFYPDAAKPESPFGQRMKEIDDALQETGDPLFNDPEKPLRIAQMTARELSIAPRRKGTPAAPVKPAAPAAVPVAKKGMVPTGGSRTTPPPTNAQPALHAEVKGAKNPHQLRQVLKKYGVRI